ncbi:MAG: outer membrane protein transport protein [Bacteroidota bacterium]
MKKIVLILIAGLTSYTIQSQNINDAMRYAIQDLNGTARFRAMSGAFGALGGDFSSLNVNPAGSVVFANNQVGFTLNNSNSKNNSNYFGKNTSENENAFDINQAGGVFIFDNPNQNTGWKKFAVAINYDNARNLNNDVFSAGTNPNNSIGNYFLSYANGIPLSVLENYAFEDLDYGEQQALLGYNTFVIDPDANNSTNNLYISNIPAGGNYYQENSFVSSGYNGKLTLNVSAEYKDKFLFGLNINSYFTDYTQTTSFYESNNNPQNADPQRTVNRLRFNSELYTYGTGLSFQLGTIFKPIKELRIGLAYESPTWYRLNDETSQSIATSGYGLQQVPDTSIYSNSAYDPRVVLIYEPYKLQTPGKVTGSLAYVFGKKGLISFDYAIKDYSKTQFRSDSQLEGANDYMENVLDMTNEFRVGAEYKIKKVSLRGGYRFEESPYKDGKTMGDLTGYSGGLGYNFGRFKVDLAYSYWERDSQQAFFSQGLTDAAAINSKNNTISASLLFEL